MRRSVSLFLAAVTAVSAVSFVASTSSAEAQARQRNRTVVVIVPRYLTAGTLVSPGETRAAVPAADARFRSAAYDIPGLSTGPYWSDPFYLRHPHTTIAVDTPFGRKLPGEQ